MAGRETQQQNDWLARLERLRGSLNESNADEIFAGICQLAEAVGNDTVEAVAAAQPELLSYSPILAEANYRRVLRKEIGETERLLKKDWGTPVAFKDVASAPSVALYDRVADIFETIRLDACRRALVVGCGRLPGTMFHIHDRTSETEVVGLDVVRESVDVANALASKLGYKRMRVVLGDGCAYDYKDAGVIFVARMVRGKQAVLSRIADTAPAGAQIVMRVPFSVGRLWSEDGERGLDARLEVVARGPTGGFGALSRNIYLRMRRGTSQT